MRILQTLMAIDAVVAFVAFLTAACSEQAMRLQCGEASAFYADVLIVAVLTFLTAGVTFLVMLLCMTVLVIAERDKEGADDNTLKVTFINLKNGHFLIRQGSHHRLVDAENVCEIEDGQYWYQERGHAALEGPLGDPAKYVVDNDCKMGLLVSCGGKKRHITLIWSSDNKFITYVKRQPLTYASAADPHHVHGVIYDEPTGRVYCGPIMEDDHKDMQATLKQQGMYIIVEGVAYTFANRKLCASFMNNGGGVVTVTAREKLKDDTNGIGCIFRCFRSDLQTDPDGKVSYRAPDGHVFIGKWRDMTKAV